MLLPTDTFSAGNSSKRRNKKSNTSDKYDNFIINQGRAAANQTLLLLAVVSIII
jgi:hypothetical protein